MAKLGFVLVHLGLLVGLASIGCPTPVAAQAARIVSVPTLGVRTDGLPGVINQVLIQFERIPVQHGPVLDFNEINLGGGSLVGEEWKDGVRHAVQAVARLVGEDGHDWRITLKNRAVTAVTDGRSSSGAIAVGILAAYRGDALRSDIAVSGVITPDGRLDVVGGLPSKLEAAAGGQYRSLVISRHQPYTSDWPQGEEAAARLRIALIQVRTLTEAYEAMTGGGR
ncbi:MAG: S16 family serine protease [Nitrospira sp.]|nr:S16 family serine protease [Nitrospira sp.]